MKKPIISLILLIFLLSCNEVQLLRTEAKSKMTENNGISVAIFAGGCFWCIESDLEKLPGVIEAISGYSGGTGNNPTYETYSQMGYIEAVQVSYDRKKLSYEELLNYFLTHIDPTDGGGQFADRGKAYKPAIFYQNDEEKNIAENILLRLDQSGKFSRPVAVEIVKYTNFYPAEDYHQNYALKNPTHYEYYRKGSGRESFLRQTWGGDICPLPRKQNKKFIADEESLRKKLSPLQYEVTQNNSTEPPFLNDYAYNEREGIYVDIVSGEPLFSSLDKYNSGTGWPSFTKPLVPENIVKKYENSSFITGTEVRSKNADSHLGHVFHDGPEPLGLRYCINSAALRFIPKEDLKKEGYSDYLKLFE